MITEGWTDLDIFTPPKFYIAPETWWLEDVFPIGKVTFQGLCLYTLPNDIQTVVLAQSILAFVIMSFVPFMWIHQAR